MADQSPDAHPRTSRTREAERGSTERSSGLYAREVRLVAVTQELAGRIVRIASTARAQAAGGRAPQLMEDVNVVLALLVEPEPSGARATMIGSGRTLDVETELVTVAEAASRLDLSPQAIRKACAEGRLVASHRGRDWVIRSDELEIFRYRRRRT